MSKFKSNFVMLADHVIEDKSNKISIIGIFDRIFTTAFPTVRHNVVLTGNLEVLDPEIDQVTLGFILKDSKGNIIGPTNVKIELDLSSLDKKEKRTGNYILRLNALPFEKEGWYTFFVSANSEDLCEYKFVVEKANQ